MTLNLSLNEGFDTWHKVRCEMGEWFRKSQHDSKVMHTLQLKSLNTAIF